MRAILRCVRWQHDTSNKKSMRTSCIKEEFLWLKGSWLRLWITCLLLQVGLLVASYLEEWLGESKWKNSVQQWWGDSQAEYKMSKRGMGKMRCSFLVNDVDPKKIMSIIFYRTMMVLAAWGQIQHTLDCFSFTGKHHLPWNHLYSMVIFYYHKDPCIIRIKTSLLETVKSSEI
jgi:hypothetical protein